MPFPAFPPEVAAEAVCAVVVAYFPDKYFAERLKSLLPQVGALVVVDNTPAPGCAREFMELRAREGQIHLIENHRNAGIAAALNQGLEHALQIGCKWLLTLDQDTLCYSDMVATLLQVHETCDPKAAVIGGNYFDAQNHQLKVPADGETECLEQKTVITSGSLVDANVARGVGGFREDYFIDQVDHEFCLRVRAHGYRVVISRKPVMEHSVGGPGGVRLPLLGILPSHAPLRKYYIARNSMVTISTYWRQEPGWCLRRFVRLILGLGYMTILEENRLLKVRAFSAGIADGIFRRLGPCRRKWLLRTD
ncbi:MAG: glycosyltransferase family 2 protein [Gammaproteobacteria bacterium]|nr:glycosyltransferase family 2 protein [Gammaproteobacteria bacterium]MBU1978764.1 glycosyltransferase family 2 protein [Gammaproteobacteria bacterium]